MKDLTNTWALVTGASSGFGIDFAHLLAERGSNLVLVARRIEPMQELAAQLEHRYAVKVKVLGRDLSTTEAASELKQTLDAQGIRITTLINNAGFGLFGEFLDQALSKTEEMLKLNMFSLTALTHVFAQDMKQHGGGNILLVASIGAYQATPTYAAYSASKAYVLLFGEALHHELAKHNIKVSVLSPGITATSFLQVSGQKATLYQRMVMMQSKPVAAIGLKALFAGKASVVPGLINKLTIFSNRFASRSIQTKLAYLLMKN
ncbi:SDR family oxidoreductase [Undibacterium sp. LX40W]|uniref:SDR family oxidoreductase n=1 Tax=Undibacterium nitidum TaxID=2762298 RepID=A0A923HRD2_9BURK|nr:MULTISPECIES: SDR family oxidoreductase [Undibacterium]MBC3883198.1 SDR family oxidoreductase [Undibacterium nitidum]MBC3893480.1 SDR family oxidoreductase [Undibacterium sp. LX40W]